MQNTTTEAAEPESTVQDFSGMTPRALAIFLTLAIAMITTGIFTQPFAYSKLYETPTVSFRPYVVGLFFALLACIVVAQWQRLALWHRLPLWASALVATATSLLLTYPIRNEEGYAIGQLGLIPILCWGALNSEARASAKLSDVSALAVSVVIGIWAIRYLYVGGFHATMFACLFLTWTARQSALRMAMIHLTGFTCSLLIVLIGMSPYRAQVFSRWLGLEEPIIWDYLRDMIDQSLNNATDSTVIIPYANSEFLLTSFTERAGWLPGALIASGSIGLLLWSTVVLSSVKKNQWQTSFGLAITAWLLPIAIVSILTNFSIALVRPGMGLPFFSPDFADLIYAGLLVGSLYSTRSTATK